MVVLKTTANQKELKKNHFRDNLKDGLLNKENKKKTTFVGGLLNFEKV